jgi:hypothetical protein
MHGLSVFWVNLIVCHDPSWSVTGVMRFSSSLNTRISYPKVLSSAPFARRCTRVFFPAGESLSRCVSVSLSHQVTLELPVVVLELSVLKGSRV